MNQRHSLIIPEDEIPFKSIFTMSSDGNKSNPIVLDGDNPVKDEPVAEVKIKTEAVSEKDEEMKAEEDATANLKPAATVMVSPDNPRKRAATNQDTTKQSELTDNNETNNNTKIETVTTTVVTKTTKDNNGNTTTAVTTTKSRFFAPPPVTVCKIIRSKKQKTKEEIDEEMNRVLRVCDYTHDIITDNPLHQAVNYEVRESDIRFMHLAEVVQDSEEPRYWVWKDIDSYKPKAASDEEAGDTCMRGCEDCFLDACCEYLYGPYLVAAVKRYYEENPHIATLRDAYVYYIGHFNRRLDIHSYHESGNAERLRASEITKPTKCMKAGSLKYCMEWVNWQLHHGPHAAFYAAERSKRMLIKAQKKAKEERYNRITKL